MAFEEGNWHNHKLESLAVTTTGYRVVWQCLLDEKKFGREQWVDYTNTEIVRLEAAYMRTMEPVRLGTPPLSWTIDLNQLTQSTDRANRSRPVRRIVVWSAPPITVAD